MKKKKSLSIKLSYNDDKKNISKKTLSQDTGTQLRWYCNEPCLSGRILSKGNCAEDFISSLKD